jgi:hypothetical protein
MLTGLPGDTPWRPTGTCGAGPSGRTLTGSTLRLGDEMSAVSAEQGRDILIIPRARNSAVRR